MKTNKLKWEIVHESDDENGNPTTWAIDIRGTEHEERLHSLFIWITKVNEREYEIEIDPYSMGFIRKMTCKTFSAAKRWVTMYLL